MLRLVLRRNRVRLVVWLLVLVGLFAYVGVYYRDLFDTQAALDDFAALSDTPSIRALTGLAAAPATLGGAVWTKIWMTLVMTLAFGVIFLVTRNGRADEELARTELLRSRMLGLHAYSVMAWAVIAGLCVAVGAGVTLLSVAVGLDPVGTNTTGSLVVGASVTGLGLVALGVGAVAGQMTSTARGANAMGAVVFGVFYVVRMVGDLGDGRLTWLSPIGWGQQMQPWGANNWGPLLLLVILAAALLAFATVLEARRDLGAGLFPERAGRPSAPRSYASPLGLALRLQRGPIVGWTLTILLSALLFGSVVEAMTDLLDDASSSAAAMLRGTGLPALLSLLISMIAMVTAVFALQSARPTTRLRQLINRTDRVLAVLHPPTAAHARIMEKAGCEAGFVGTGGVVGAYTGLADVGTLTMTECVQIAGWIAAAVNFPVIMDGDTGHGGIMAVRRMVRECIRAGIAGMRIDDQPIEGKRRTQTPASRSCRSSRRSPAIAPRST